ncbi:MAG TPA: LytR C-terminal domain-containing protein [Acidimicrobiales bacterium]|nr:LytR C-terminal domain-containing protein [Acidimicrobiales bacterium]
MSRRPPPRPAVNTAARGAIVVVVAVLLGIWILTKIDSGAAVDAGSGETSAPTTVATTVPTSVTAPPTTAVDKASFTVMVANASGTSGAAKRKGDAMKADGYQVAEPVTNQTKADTTTIFYVNGYDAHARVVAEKLNVSDIQPMPTPPPVDIGQAQVLVNLGRDIASEEANQVTTTT